MNDFEVQWEDPPPSSARRHAPDLLAFYDTLRENPKRWARYPRELAPGSASKAANNINRGASLGGAGFEATTRKDVLYVRYVDEDV